MIDGAIINCESSSKLMRGTTSLSGAFPCQAGLSSICSTDFPFIVLEMIMVGSPLVASALEIAESICSIRWPSISITFHPKDLHLSPVFHLEASFHISERLSPSSSSSSGITFSV